MMIFRYWLTNGRTFDEVSPVQDAPVDQVRDHLAASLCPPVQHRQDAKLVPAFHVTDINGVAHVVVTVNLVEVEVLDLDPVDLPSKYQVEVHSGHEERMAQASRDMRGSWTQEEPAPPPPYPPADGDVVGYYRDHGNPHRAARRAAGGPFGGHNFT